MNKEGEVALIGWKAIAKMFGVHEKTMQNRRRELLQYGAIFYMRHGRPPKKRVCAFPSLLKVWTILRSDGSGEAI
jgi:hypothetical protein